MGGWGVAPTSQRSATLARLPSGIGTNATCSSSCCVVMLSLLTMGLIYCFESHGVGAARLQTHFELAAVLSDEGFFFRASPVVLVLGISREDMLPVKKENAVESDGLP